MRRRIGWTAVGIMLVAGCAQPVTPTRRPVEPVGASAAPGTKASPTASPAGGLAPGLAAGVRGIVTGLDGAPAAGVAIRAFVVSNSGASLVANNGAALVSDHGAGAVPDAGGDLGGQTKLTLLQAAFETRTGGDGRFHLDVPPGQDVNVEAVARDDVKAFVANARAGREVAMALKKTGAIAGRIQPPEGSGVTDLTGLDIFIPGSSYLAKADQAGAFRIDNVPEGAFTLIARSDLGEAIATGVRVAPEATTAAPALLLRRDVPRIARILPAVAAPGMTVTVEGENFGARRGAPIVVTLGGRIVSGVQRLDDGRLAFAVPPQAGGDLVVEVAGAESMPVALEVAETLAVRAWAPTMRVGEVSYVSWRLGGPGGRPIEEAPITWSADGDAVEVVDGRLEAVRVGRATVTAAFGGIAATATVEVVAEPIVRTFVGYPEPAFAPDEATRTAAYAAFRHALHDVSDRAAASKEPEPWSLAFKGADLHVTYHQPGRLPARLDLGRGVVTPMESAAGLLSANVALTDVTVAPDGTLYGLTAHPRFGIFRFGDGAPTAILDGRRTGYADGAADQAAFETDIWDFTVAADGTTYFLDRKNNAVRARHPDGRVSTVLGGPGLQVAIAGGEPLVLDPTTIAIAGPNALIVNTHGYLLRFDPRDPAAGATVLAGAREIGFADGPAGVGRLNGPGVQPDGAGGFFMSDHFNHALRRIASDGTLSTVIGGTGDLNLVDGPARVARLHFPTGLAVDPGRRYVAITEPKDDIHRIRFILY